MAKCKQKTHKGSKKVLKLKKNGTVVAKSSGGNHLTGKDSGKQVRQRRGYKVLSKGETSRLKSVI